MNRREAERLVTALRDARVSGARAAMATAVRVQGSAYRRAGARLLIREDGVVEGAFWGGAIERALAIDAASVLATGEPIVVTYDLADESPGGFGIGCPGSVDFLLERVEDEPVTNAWLTVLERGDLAVLITPLSAASGRRLLYASGYAIGHLDDPALERLADDRAQEWLREPLHPCSLEDVGGAEVLFDVGVPPTELVIFGAGYDAEVLARQATWLGFVVMVVDSRGGFIDTDRFHGARVIFAPSDRLAESVVISDGSFVVVMNHDLGRDQDALRFSLDSGAAHVGVLGPRTRLRRMLANLSADGYAPDRGALARIRSPIGLSVGAETPEEIAVSITAEILAMARGFDGSPLNGTDDALHHREIVGQTFRSAG